MDVEWHHPPLNYAPSEVSALGNLLHANWDISTSQLKFCYTSTGCAALPTLLSRPLSDSVS